MTACTVCSARGIVNRFACTDCESKVGHNLGSLAGPRGLYAQLAWAGPSLLAPGASRGSSDGRSATKVDAPAPVNLRVINLLSGGGAVHVLNSWLSRWYDDRGFSVPSWSGPIAYQVVVSPVDGKPKGRPGQLDLVVRALGNNLGWAVENRSDFKDFATSVRHLVRDICSTLDPSATPARHIPIGKCPTPVDGGTCCTVLTASPASFSITCPGCFTTWNRKDWVRLGQGLAPTA